MIQRLWTVQRLAELGGARAFSRGGSLVDRTTLTTTPCFSHPGRDISQHLMGAKVRGEQRPRSPDRASTSLFDRQTMPAVVIEACLAGLAIFYGEPGDHHARVRRRG